MYKPFSIMSIRQTPDARAAERLAARICEKKLQRRQRVTDCDPDALAWLETATTMWRMNAQPRAPQACDPDPTYDFLWPEPSDEPRISDYPRYPRTVDRTVRQRVEMWCSERLKKVKLPGHPVSEKLSDLEKKEIRDASAMMSAAFLGEHQIDEAFSAIHKEFPWLGRLTEKAWRQALRRCRSGLPAGVGPLLLMGPPGLGKSSWARAVADRLGVPRLDLDAGQSGGVMDLQGTAKGWGSAERGRLMGKIISERVANPMVILDEIDAGSREVSTTRGGMPGLHKVMMGMIEPSSAASWTCPYYQVPVDLRHVSWIATSNRLDGIEQALLDRMTVVELDDLTDRQILDFARYQASTRLGDDLVDTVLVHVENSIRGGRRLSLRHIVRVLDRVEEQLDRPRLH